jgi:sugar lactone lactonase YvrE
MSGAVQLTDNSGNLLVSTMVHGQGQGPAIAFGSGVQTTVQASEYTYGVAVDAAGDVFITGNNQVVEVPAGGGAQTTVPASGLSGPWGVAVDGAGDVFIADTGNNRVVEVPAGGGAQTTVGSGLSYPVGVAVDGAGDVFIADTYNNRVVEVPAGGGAQSTLATNGLNQPYGVAVDGTGDVFISDPYNNRVVEVPAGGGVQTTVAASGLDLPNGVAVDGAGDVFIADTGNNRVVEVPAGGGAQTTVLASGLNQPLGVAVDRVGDAFIANGFGSNVVEVQRALPPALSFASTGVGSTSGDSPQSVTIQNIGNQPLNAITPGLVVGGPNFLQVPGSGTPSDCTGSFALTPGATCNLSISFEPQSVGNLTSTAVFTDNALNASPSAAQSIALQGTGTQASVNVSVGTSPAGLSFSVDGTTYGSAQSFTWNIGSLHTIATSTPQTPVAGYQYTFTSWSDGGALSHSVTASGSTTSYTASFNTSYLLTTAANPTNGGTVTPASGTYYAANTVVNLTATANTGYAFSSWTGSVANPGSASTTVTMSAPETVMANFAASATPTTTTLMSSLNPSTYGQSVMFTATVSSNDGTPNGNVNFKNGTTSFGTVKLVSGSASLTTSALNAGSLTITAHYSGSTKYVASSSTLTQTVNKVATTTTITSASPSPSTYGQPVTFTATVSTAAGSASGNVEFKLGTLKLGSGTLSGGSASYTTTATQIPGGEDAITAVYNGDANHAASTSAAYTQTVNKEATTTSLKTSGSPSTQGNPLTFTATVSSSVGTPAGNVVFKDGTTLLGTVALSGGTAQFTTSALAVGTHAIHADYQGNGNYAVSSGQVTQVVDP